MPEMDDDALTRERDQAGRRAWRVAGMSLAVALVTVGILVATVLVVAILTVDQWSQ